MIDVRSAIYPPFDGAGWFASWSLISHPQGTSGGARPRPEFSRVLGCDLDSVGTIDYHHFAPSQQCALGVNINGLIVPLGKQDDAADLLD